MRLARHIYLDALTATLFAGRLGGGHDTRQVATAALAAPPSPSPPRAADLLLDGLALLITQGHTVATPTLRKALTAFHSEEIGAEEGLRWLWPAGRPAGFIWDYESWDSLTARQVRVAREVGALGHLPLAFSTRVEVHLFAGELQAAASLVEQSDALADATYSRIVPLYGALALAAFVAARMKSRDWCGPTCRTSSPAAKGVGLTVSQWVTAALYNGLARYDDAFTAAADATTDPHELWFSTFATVELIEAASRSGRTDRAAEAFDLLRESTSASGTRGRWAWKHARGRSSVTRKPPRRSTETRSIFYSRHAFVWTWRGLICSTGSGCAANAAALTHGISCGSPMSSLPTSGWRRSPSGHEWNYRLRASAPGNGRWTLSTSSLRRRRRSPN